MPLVFFGVLLIALKVGEIGPFTNLSWWFVLAPFGIAALWWQFADTTGWTQRRAMDKMEKRKADRRDRQMVSLGLDHRREKQVTRARHEAARLASADPTQAADVAPSGGSGEPLTRREPRL